jgi:hypothetical protein
MEFDGWHGFTLVPPPGAELPSLVLEILPGRDSQVLPQPGLPAVDGSSLDEPEFLPYAWLGSEERGLSWFMESAANWRRGLGVPAMTLHREREAVVVRLKIVSQAVRVEQPLSYTIGFEPTPVRPLSPQLYDWWFGSGAPIRGSNFCLRLGPTDLLPERDCLPTTPANSVA